MYSTVDVGESWEQIDERIKYLKYLNGSLFVPGCAHVTGTLVIQLRIK
jgi:hypothetical protein